MDQRIAVDAFQRSAREQRGVAVDAELRAEGTENVFVAGASLPGATPCARLHARAVLSEWGLGELAEAAELIVSELVTNAVRASTAPDGHPRYDGAGMPVVVLRMASDRIKLMIEVWDVIPGAPAAAHPGPDDESGRGLMLVAAQCDRWSWQSAPGWPGKVVWAELHG